MIAGSIPREIVMEPAAQPPEHPVRPKRAPAPKGQCAITGRERSRRELVMLSTLRPNLVDRIHRDYPDLPGEALVSRSEVERFRTLYVEEILKHERGDLSTLDKQVAESLAKHETLAEDVQEEYEEKRSLGDRLADKLASFGGSWSFLIAFAVVLVVWMGLNVVLSHYDRAFDEYPFILLNLVLSCLAAIQAPVIMMSQRRVEAKDRLRSQNDYRVNLKAELEIRLVHEKIDHLIQAQWHRLAEIQELQLEIMQEGRTRR
jgi:uncharacterized membrane protein